LWRGYIEFLADCGLPGRAADAAEEAIHALGTDGSLQLLEATYAGKAGQIERAERIFAALAPDVPGRNPHEAVHRIRTGEYDRALFCVEDALGENNWDLALWGIAELIYRKIGDSRSEWLSGQSGLVSALELPLDPSSFAAIDSALGGLHSKSVEAVGQSVRGGTQTRWHLFDRLEPELAALQSAIELALGEYQAALPPCDPTHPLLRHRDQPLKIGPSWSVRFVDSGHHVPHFHPMGLASSACYFRVPRSAHETREGWLEIGRPPPDFRMELEPLRLIEPAPGKLALFPSYLFHGTTPFKAGERMSVAFDVTAGDGG
jgi:hypothetical protein